MSTRPCKVSCSVSTVIVGSRSRYRPGVVVGEKACQWPDACVFHGRPRGGVGEW